ncbi:hypothetical protein [Roseomonas sp. KE2513]|uniref:hypothetical protein n=1 Tax=Roseomonas sp. KE2513 TaxID=2479202 RepID=UPI0018DF2DA6|nr:hypothetical protein [Roseomonas sp. KE2513]
MSARPAQRSELEAQQLRSTMRSGIDRAPVPHYLIPMRGFLRTVLLALILAFAAGTVLHADRAAAMDLAMAVAPSAGMPMPGCDGCGDDGDDPGSAMASCAVHCATPPMTLPAFLPQVAPSAPLAAEPVADPLAPVEFTGPPDLHPPRTIVLS